MKNKITDKIPAHSHYFCYDTSVQPYSARAMLRIFSASAMPSDQSHVPWCVWRWWRCPHTARGPHITAAPAGARGGATLLWCRVPEEEDGQQPGLHCKTCSHCTAGNYRRCRHYCQLCQEEWISGGCRHLGIFFFFWHLIGVTER